MKSIVAGFVLALTVGCASPIGSAAAPTVTAIPKMASVIDLSVPFASSESDALVPRGFLGLAQFGRLDIGCTVEILKTTDHAAQVKLVSCPRSSSPPDQTPPAGTQGWVAKSALDLTSP